MNDPIGAGDRPSTQQIRTTSHLGKPTPSDRGLLVIASIVAAAWFLILSYAMDYRPGRLPVEQNDVLFNSDAASWIGWLSGDEKQLRPSPLHALVNVVWRPLGRALYAAYHLFLPYEEAR